MFSIWLATLFFIVVAGAFGWAAIKTKHETGIVRTGWGIGCLVFLYIAYALHKESIDRFISTLLAYKFNGLTIFIIPGIALVAVILFRIRVRR
jgi:hypothetical protein